MAVRWGFDTDRDKWSRDASQRLVIPVLRESIGAQQVYWMWEESTAWMDMQFGVDALVQTNRRNVALAIRLRGRSYYDNPRFRDITIRYESLQTLGKALEMQKSIARYLFYGWCDTDRPQRPERLVGWHIVRLQELVDQALRGDLPIVPICNRDGSSKFVAFTVDELIQHRLILRSSRINAQAA